MALSTHQLDSNQDIGSLFFKHPSNIFISGPSGSGKTEFVKKVIEFKEELFDILPPTDCLVLQGMAKIL